MSKKLGDHIVFAFKAKETFLTKKPQTNFYLILNISPQSSLKEIKKSYLKLAQAYHPDKNPRNKLAEKKFKQINSAWEILKDPKKRKLFNESLKKPNPPTPQKARSSAKTTKIILEKPIDLKLPLRLSLEEFCQRRLKTISYFRPVNGQKTHSSLKIQIPKGISPSACLYFKGKGGAEGKKVFGDLYVKIQLKIHKIFKWRKNSRDISLDRPISFISALKNKTLDVPTPYGFLTVNIEPPLKHKELLKVKGYGLLKSSKEEKGDLLVRILVDYPLKNSSKIKYQISKLNFKQKKIYVEKFKNSDFIYPKILKFEKKIRELEHKCV